MPVVDGIITDTSRIIAVKSSIKKLISKKNKIFLLAHFGRPNGEVVNKFSLSFILPSLKELFDVDKIYFLKNLDEESFKKRTEDMQRGDLCLVENIRFRKEEEKIDLRFAKRISTFIIYQNIRNKIKFLF